MTTLDALLRDTVRLHATRPAVVVDGRTLTYAELDTAIDRAGSWLAQQGCRPGRRVTLQLDKGLALLLMHLACLRRGYVSVLVNPRAPQPELEHVLRDSGATVHVATTSAPRSSPGAVPGSVVDARLDPGADFDDVEIDDARSSPDAADLACLLYTSGTTGQPKGARLLQRNLVANVSILRTAWGWTEDDRILHVLPLFHVHGLFVAATTALVAGACIELEPGFDAAPCWDALRSGRISVFMGVPTHYHRLLRDAPQAGPIADLPVRLFTSGSAPLRPETTAAFRALTGHTILERYGMTEVGMAASNPLVGERRVGSVGPALPGVALRVVDSSGRARPQGEVGEVLIRGPSVFAGYWERPEADAEVFDEQGWLRSGDLGYLDEDGYLFLVGRTRELILSGGFNVYPREVEEALDSHPSVAESAVCGLPDDDLGERVVAGVVLASGATADPEALAAHTRERLAAYKVPKVFAFMDALPRNAMGKLQRDQLARLDAFPS